MQIGNLFNFLLIVYLTKSSMDSLGVIYDRKSGTLSDVSAADVTVSLIAFLTVALGAHMLVQRMREGIFQPNPAHNPADLTAPPHPAPQ